MGKTRSMIDDEAKRFIEAQHMFFVASAPLDAGGHVNLSPKGLDTFRILGPTTVAYIDFNGSGVETIAHLREKDNGRIVLMFCTFQGHRTFSGCMGAAAWSNRTKRNSPPSRKTSQLTTAPARSSWSKSTALLTLAATAFLFSNMTASANNFMPGRVRRDRKV
jgi:hypothetical protein